MKKKKTDPGILSFEKLNDELIQIFEPSGMLLGELAPDSDGYFYFFPGQAFNGSYLSAWILTAIAQRLDKINRAYDRQVARELKKTCKKS